MIIAMTTQKMFYSFSQTKNYFRQFLTFSWGFAAIRPYQYYKV